MENIQNIIGNIFEFVASILGLKKNFWVQKLVSYFSAILVELIIEKISSCKT